MRWWRPLAGVLVILGLLAGCGGPAQPGGSRTPARTTTTAPGPTTGPRPSPTPGTTSATVAPSRVAVGRDAWVAVSVATLWRSPESPRPVDAPALENPARVRAWLSGMSTADRLGLVDRADTQALLGDLVRVTALRGRYAEVVVPDQPTPLDSRGYPGWLPLAQLTSSAPPAAADVATVVSRTAWLVADGGSAERVVEASFGTRLPVVGAVDGAVRVGLPGGRVLRVPTRDVAVTGRGEPALPAEGTALVRSATMFTGLPYLWAGTSGFGFDCSGLTFLVHRVHGVSIPRDAGPQSVSGTPVASAALRPGDLLFYTRNGVVHHVALYTGAGRMVQAPSTGHTVETIAVDAAPFANEFSGARRLGPDP